MHMFFGGDPQIVIGVSSPKLPSSVMLSVKLINFQISGPMRVTMAPLLRDDPFVGGLSLMFMEPPSLR
jgi:hypothetical protein